MRKPVYHVFVTQESQPNAQGEKNTYWTKVGVAFAHNGKPGLNIVLISGTTAGCLYAAPPTGGRQQPEFCRYGLPA